MTQPSNIFKSGKLNNVWNFLPDQLKAFANKLAPYIGISTLGDTNFPLIPGTVGPKVSFKKSNYGNEVDVIIPGVLEITRGNNQGIFNIAVEGSYGSSSPLNTEWNNKPIVKYTTITPESGWAVACNAKNLEYALWNDSIGRDWSNPSSLVDQKMQTIMHETTTDRYWLIQFTDWTKGGYGGGFAYDRWEIYPKVDFVRPSLQPDIVDVITPGKTIIKRLNKNGLFNAAVEKHYAYLPNSTNGYPKTPTGTLWNSIYTDTRPGYSGWNNLTNIKNRIYSNWSESVDGNPPDSVTNNLELIMLDQATGYYYMVQFTNWGSGGNDGAFSYTRRLIPMTKSVDFGSAVELGQGGSIDYAYIKGLETTIKLNNIKTIDDSPSYTIEQADAGKMLIFTSATQINLESLPFTIGTQIDIVNYNSLPIAFTSDISVTINSVFGNLILADQFTAATLIYTATDNWMLFGKLSS